MTADAPAKRAAVFLNEGAGSARTDRVRRAVELARRGLDADLHVVATRDVAELGEWLSDRVEGYETAVIAGGDGSLGVAYNVLAGRPDVTLGYIPAGFGNATSHLLRLPRGAEALVQVLVRGEARPVDLVALNSRLALFASAGWDALVAGRYAAAGARRLPGWGMAVARSVPDLWRRPVVEVRADGRVVHDGPMEFLIAGTTPFYGRGLLVNPGARSDAGRLAMRVYPGPVARFALEAGRWALRVAPQAPRIDATRVELRVVGGEVPAQADGDLVGTRGDWTFEIRPAAVRLIGNWS
ncbi:MAG TPA: diacylglycerol kinase family protein [Methylomirabilota bacterium]|nr:diacylglycerol kinase family protein [Methylomirabilota bacterium]